MGMNKRHLVGPAARLFRLLFASILLVLAGRTFNAGGQTETNLYSFGISPGDGQQPWAGLVQGSDGNFYGTTYGGGTHSSGTVFRISPGGSYTNLYSFGSSPNDGIQPQAGLVQGSDGNFYGTTWLGGTSTNCPDLGCGTVYRISPDGTETTLYSFTRSANDGAFPNSVLVQSSDGNLYGTTGIGGPYGRGTVFRISPSGNHTNLYSFGPPPDGSNPFAALVEGSDGNFYGTTGGGAYGSGTVFRISPDGNYTNLYSFGSHPNDGSDPHAGLVRGSDGNFYGTTAYGGASTNCNGGGCGTIFRIGPSGNYTNLYSFGGHPNGWYAFAGLVQGSDGDFYGTTVGGGQYGQGNIFRISPSGSCTNVYSLGSSPNDGIQPLAGLVQGSDGSFYGTTYIGGTTNEGTVFKLTIPLNPPANQISGVQMSGSDIVFTIPSVAYETYQLQFSSSMNPTNWINEGGSITSVGALLTVTNLGGATGPQGLYRFAITP
jgi:uncharacterized repeat protein (TIGR03803 family)